MRFERTELEGVVLVEPDIHRDPRGFFMETFHARKYAEGGITASGHRRKARPSRLLIKVGSTCWLWGAKRVGNPMKMCGAPG